MPMAAPRGSEEEEEEVAGIGMVVSDGDGDAVGFEFGLAFAFGVEDSGVCVEGGGDAWEDCVRVGEDSGAIVGACNICVCVCGGDTAGDENVAEDAGEDAGPEICVSVTTGPAWNATPVVIAETTPVVSNNTLHNNTERTHIRHPRGSAQAAVVVMMSSRRNYTSGGGERDIHIYAARSGVGTPPDARSLARDQ